MFERMVLGDVLENGLRDMFFQKCNLVYTIIVCFVEEDGHVTNKFYVSEDSMVI